MLSVMTELTTHVHDGPMLRHICWVFNWYAEMDQILSVTRVILIASRYTWRSRHVGT